MEKTESWGDESNKRRRGRLVRARGGSGWWGGGKAEREGCAVRLMDGWRTESTGKVERNKRKGGGGGREKEKPVNLCLVNLSIPAAGALSPAAATI